jgi:hypothetical protein
MARSLFPRTLAVLAVGAVLAAGVAPLSAADVFKVRMLTGKAPVEPPMINVQIEVDAWTTPDEVQQLEDALAKGSIGVFMDAFNAMNKGVVRIMSTRGWNLPIHAAQVIYTNSGKKVLIFLNRQSWDPGSFQKPARHYFMIMELRLDMKGKGEGRFYEDAQIKLDTIKGTIEMETYESAPKIFPQVREVIKKPEKNK